MATDMNWELAEFSLDRESRSARYAFRHQGGHGAAADEHVAIQVRVSTTRASPMSTFGTWLIRD